MQPATPYALFGYFDFILLAIVILFNFLIIKFDFVKVITWKVAILRSLVLFLVFPLLSIKVEVDNVYREFVIVDGFNLLYIWFRWPTWWLLGIIEIIVSNQIVNKKAQRKIKTAPNQA